MLVVVQELSKCLKAGIEIVALFEKEGFTFTNYTVDCFNHELWLYLYINQKSIIATYNAITETTIFLYGYYDKAKQQFNDFQSLIEAIKNDTQTNSELDGTSCAIDDSLFVAGTRSV